MSESSAVRAREQLAGHDRFDRRTDESGAPDRFELQTVPFKNSVVAGDSDEGPVNYTITVTVPTLEGATTDEVGDAVATGWLETLERRLKDAPKATRATVTLAEFNVEQVADSVVVTYAFTSGVPERAVDVAKTLVEYVEGTYVEGIVPGYEYEPPVADLLADASQNGSGGTPL